MLLAVLNDSHFGARNSSEIFLDYTGRFFTEVFFPYCEQRGIKQILHLGDFYDHRKYINFKAQNHARKVFLDPLVKLGMTMDIIPGNHDLYHNNTSTLCSLKELLGYYVENVNIVMKPRVMDYAGVKIALLPWINSENEAESLQFIQSCAAPILAGHLELVGFPLLPGQMSTHGMESSVFSRFETVWSGHYHCTSRRGNIHYLGTQYEMTWADCNDDKHFHVFDTETRQLYPARNHLTLFSKVYYDDKNGTPENLDVSTLAGHFVKVLVSNKTDTVRFDRFMDRILAAGVLETSIIENFEEFLGENAAMLDTTVLSDTPELLGVYVDGCDTALDKERLKDAMKQLYVEASVIQL